MSYDPVPGMLVVCIDDKGHYGPWAQIKGATLDGLTRGTVYTIRDAGEYSGQPCIWLVEIRRPVWSKFGEPGYHPARFRPIDERRLDVFREALRKAPAPRERVEA